MSDLSVGLIEQGMLKSSVGIVSRIMKDGYSMEDALEVLRIKDNIKEATIQTSNI